MGRYVGLKLLQDSRRRDSALHEALVRGKLARRPEVLIKVVREPCGDVPDVLLRMLVGKILGLAVVWQGHELTWIGNDWAVGYLSTQELPTAARDVYMASAGCIGVLDYPAPAPTTDRERERREQLRRVAHKVVELWPDLREWRRSKPGEPEVLLRPYAGDVALGGAVWTSAYYLSGKFHDTLGLTDFFAVRRI